MNLPDLKYSLSNNPQSIRERRGLKKYGKYRLDVPADKYVDNTFCKKIKNGKPVEKKDAWREWLKKQKSLSNEEILTKSICDYNDETVTKSK